MLPVEPATLDRLRAALSRFKRAETGRADYAAALAQLQAARKESARLLRQHGQRRAQDEDKYKGMRWGGPVAERPRKSAETAIREIHARLGQALDRDRKRKRSAQSGKPALQPARRGDPIAVPDAFIKDTRFTISDLLRTVTGTRFGIGPERRGVRQRRLGSLSDDMEPLREARADADELSERVAYYLRRTHRLERRPVTAGGRLIAAAEGPLGSSPREARRVDILEWLWLVRRALNRLRRALGRRFAGLKKSPRRILETAQLALEASERADPSAHRQLRHARAQLTVLTQRLSAAQTYGHPNAKHPDAGRIWQASDDVSAALRRHRQRRALDTSVLAG